MRFASWAIALSLCAAGTINCYFVHLLEGTRPAFGNRNANTYLREVVLSSKKEIPKRLYKYRVFSNRTLDALIADQMFFADPSTFNDPLDTKPSLDADIDADALATILARLIEQHIIAEMSAAAKMIRYSGPKTLSHIAVNSRRRAEQMIAEIRYDATNPEYGFDDPARFLFGRYVEDELLRRYDKGIVSLAERANCPLMWSHYGDQHKGVCIGYSVPDRAAGDVRKISYGGSRLVAASTVAAMLGGDDEARHTVDDAVLTRKAIDWRYEREWRLIGPRGPQNSPLELEEVVFGMRCSDTVKYAIVQALADRSRRVKFYEIRERRGRFLLGRYALDTDKLAASLPRRALDGYDYFKELSNEAQVGHKIMCKPASV